MSTDRSVEQWRRSRVRTFHGRHGRMTERIDRLLHEVAPRYGLAARPDPDRALVLEVGCGHGDAAVAFASAHPDVDVLAVDVHAPGVAHLAEVREGDGPRNLYLERVDGLALLDERIATASLAGVHLFFPDPWPKARHHKRRFVRPDVLDLLADRMAPGASLLVATDRDDYADWAREHLDEHAAFEGGIAPRPSWRPVTRYERAGLEAGRTITDLRYHRR